jgi:hypothetical protein
MYNGQTVSLKSILWSILRNPNYAELNPEDAAELAVEAIRLLGTPLAYIDKVTTPPIEIKQYKGRLPDNIIQIKGVRYISNMDNYEDHPIALTYATDTFHESIDCIPSNKDCPIEFTYIINSGVIKTSFETGHVEVAYKTLETCEDNYPLIPDDEDTKLAIEYYIRFRYLEPLWEMGKITDKVFNYVDQKKCWYMGAAQTSLQLAGMDHVEAVMSTINRLIIQTTAHDSSFKRSGKTERIKKYN